MEVLGIIGLIVLGVIAFVGLGLLGWVLKLLGYVLEFSRPESINELNVCRHYKSRNIVFGNILFF